VVNPSLRPSVHSFVCYKNYEHGILKANETILMPSGISDPRARARHGQLGDEKVKGQSHTSWR